MVENVCGAQTWVGRAAWHFGSFYLWGDVPALMPIPLRRDAKVPGLRSASVEGVKQRGSGAEWFDTGLCRKSSKSNARKAASAHIAKIPFALASHIARSWHP